MPISLTLQRKLRRWHRGLAVITALQLLAWTLSGVFFALVDIEHVRGSQHRQPVESGTINLADMAWQVSAVEALELRQRRPGEWIVGVRREEGTRWFDASGEELQTLGANDALLLVNRQTDLAVTHVEWVDEPVEGSEFRGRPLPLWRAYATERPTTVAYLDATSGEVVAIRNTAWRWWDFLWSLHIMDYDDRDTIGTVLLKVFSVLAVFTALAGIVLFLVLPRKLH